MMPRRSAFAAVCLTVCLACDDKESVDQLDAGTSDTDADGSSDTDPCVCPLDEVIDVGHRGTGKNAIGNPYPENTVPSFLQAVAEGAQMVELDVTRSGDGALVIIHDNTVDRTTGSTGCVGELTLDELKALDAAYGTPLEGTGVTIPTLQEVLDEVEADLDVEIKTNHSTDCPVTDVAVLAVEVATTLLADTVDREIIVTSFDLELLLAVQSAAPELGLGLLALTPADAVLADEHGFDALLFSGNFFGPEEVQQIHDAGLKAGVWTINDPVEIEDFLAAEVEFLITDEPDVLESVRDTWCTTFCDE